MPFEGKFCPEIRVALKVRLFYAIRRVKGSRKMTRQFKKQVQNQSQSGRSMIEMLGVLAIIAILSIGGIVGYKLAMNYYQADQIANEINLMRNDLKVKYALGNEELLLGDPYDETPDDEHYSGHLSTQYDRYPVDYDCIRKDKAEFYNCRETDAYYIKVGNVSKGVCKPLTTLVAAMDGLMYIEINKKVYKEDDLCDEANEFYIQFDAEEVNGNYDSNRPEGWCAKDDDCEEPQVCDKESNTCVECTENAHCASNICRKDHTCGECTKDSDCANTETPKCNQSTNTCESCPPTTPKWYNNKCVECITYNDCTDIDKPNCNQNKCERCPDTASRWDGEKCVGCNDNDDCYDGKYCDMDVEGCNNGEPYGASRRCWTPQYTSYTINGKTYYKSKSFMDWWTAEKFCMRVGEKEGKSLRRISLAELGCNTSTCNDTADSLWKQFKTKGLNDWLWTSDENNDCYAYIVDLKNETVLFKKKHYDTVGLEPDALCVSN